jgi:formyltetrahydrofolate deformylase
MENAVFLIQCSDQKGIVAKISDFVFRYNGNIIQSDQYTTDPQNGCFFMRIEFCFDPEFVSRKHLEDEFGILARTLSAQWTIHYTNVRSKVGILVSKQDHCLADILYRWKSNELRIDIPLIISNHASAKEMADHYSIPFVYIPVETDTKAVQEKAIVDLVKDSTDLLILARYMQVLSEQFLKEYKKDIINIHHSFLPSFKGANPYRQAYDRGVKVIGATAHYVSGDLDEGPIIEQVVQRVSHRDTVEILMRKGRNLEQVALANALRAHVEHRVIRYQNKTVVFES